MPHTSNFRRLIAGSTGQRKSILRNLVSSLIIHESITTTLTKAKNVQSYAERVITMGKKYTGRRDQRERATAYLYDWKITLPKLFDELAARYRMRPGGYTRVHRLPPRYGDMAPQAILELIDGKRDMQWCMTARKVARSQLLGTKWLSESTRNAMYQLLQFRGEEGGKEFDEEIERQKKLLMREDKLYDALQKRKQTKTLRDIQDRIDERARYTTSIHNRKAIRKLEESYEEKKQRDAYVSQEELRAEREKEIARRKGEKTPENQKDVIPLEKSKEQLRKERRKARREEKARATEGKEPVAEKKDQTPEKQVTEH